MSDLTTTPTPTEPHQDVREEWAARLQCADVGVDFPWLTEDGCDVWLEQSEAAQEHYRNLLRVALSAGLQIPPPAAVSAPDLDAIRALRQQYDRVLDGPATPETAEIALELADAMVEKMPALLAALAAAHAETERLRRRVVEAPVPATDGDQCPACGCPTTCPEGLHERAAAAEAALAALRERIEDEADAFGQLAAQAEGLSFDPAQQARGVAYRLAERSCRNALELAAAPSETEEGR